MTVHRWLSATLGLFLLGGGGCGAPPATSATLPAGPTPVALAKRRVDVPDDCAVEPGKPPPEPLRIPYSGVARAAQCQRAVYTIMGGLTHFLGVECRHCHLEPDYAADTHNKQIANWMARELVPRLQKRASERGEDAVWCQDCHAGQAKLLGNPRRRDVAIEWMTTHLVDDFATTTGKPPQCKQCHGGDLGSSEFRPKIILSDLGGLPPPRTVAAASEPPTVADPQAEPPASAPASPPSASATPPTPVPDFGGR